MPLELGPCHPGSRAAGGCEPGESRTEMMPAIAHAHLEPKKDKHPVLKVGLSSGFLEGKKET